MVPPLPYHIIKVYCRSCHSLLLTYHKGGRGHLIKLHLHKIVQDLTVQRGVCWKCGTDFGREAIIKNRPALKVIGGKVYWK